MITTIKLTHPLLHIVIFFFKHGEKTRFTFSSFQVYRTVLLITFTMLYIRSYENLITKSLYIFSNISPFTLAHPVEATILPLLL